MSAYPRITPGVNTRSVEYVYGREDQQMYKVGYVASGNGSVNFDKIDAGTTMALDANGRYRPCVDTLADGAGAGVTTLILDSTSGIFAGDVLSVNGVSKTVLSVTDDTTLELTAVATWSDNDPVFLVNGGVCVGFLRHAVDTFDYRDPATGNVHAHQEARIHVSGAVVEANCTNLTAQVKTDLGQHFIYA